MHQAMPCIAFLITCIVAVGRCSLDLVMVVRGGVRAGLSQLVNSARVS